MRACFDDPTHSLPRKCVESRREQKDNNMIKLAIERVPTAVIAKLEAERDAKVAAVRSRPAGESAAATVEEAEIALFATIVTSEFKSGNVTGIRVDK